MSDISITAEGTSLYTNGPGIQELQKSHIRDLFEYGENKVRVSKTGKQIKEMLSGKKARSEANKIAIQAKMKACITECGFAPDEDCDYYMYAKYGGVCGDVLCYSDKYCYSSDGGDESVKQCCRRYNQYARDYVNCCVDCHYIDTMINNVEDNKSYNLSISQIAELTK